MTMRVTSFKGGAVGGGNYGRKFSMNPLRAFYYRNFYEPKSTVNYHVPNSGIFSKIMNNIAAIFNK